MKKKWFTYCYCMYGEHTAGIINADTEEQARLLLNHHYANSDVNVDEMEITEVDANKIIGNCYEVFYG